jgi:NAD(P)-dependent dehydrogenase (short-subunit alcohol dehydrogenase family)
MTSSSSTRYAVITGSAKGLGKALALYMAARDWHIAVADVDLDAARQTCDEILATGGSAQPELLDVSREESFIALRTRLERSWPRLDMLVNNAGVCVSGELGEMRIDDWDWLIGVNLRGAVIGANVMVPWLKAHPSRSYLVNISSICAYFAPPGFVAYNISKAGLISLTETLYSELRGTPVSTTAIAPWFVNSNLLDSGRFANPAILESARHTTNTSPISPERFARETYRAALRGKLYHVVGRRATMLTWFKRVFPKTFYKLSALSCRIRTGNIAKKLEQSESPEAEYPTSRSA